MLGLIIGFGLLFHSLFCIYTINVLSKKKHTKKVREDLSKMVGVMLTLAYCILVVTLGGGF